MKTSKILTLGLSFLMVGALASCGASEDDKAAVETALEKSRENVLNCYNLRN